jgi:hypothetical protein
MNAQNQATIERLYAAFARWTATPCRPATPKTRSLTTRSSRCSGGARSAACGACCAPPHATRAGRTGSCETRDITDHSAHWDAHYRSRPPAARSLNRIDAEFEFDAQGLIVKHRDRFDFWAWSRQALGVPGLVLGWTPPFRKQVKRKAAANLQRFLDKA